jgi:hypothetical protein
LSPSYCHGQKMLLHFWHSRLPWRSDGMYAGFAGAKTGHCCSRFDVGFVAE